MVDTMSSDVVVAAASCAQDPGSGCSGISTLYDYSKSSTAVNGSESVSIPYGGVSAAGYTFTDTIQLGPYSASVVRFLPALKLSPGWLTDPISGVLGLSFAGRAETTATPFWQRIIASGEAAVPQMGFWLSRSTSTTGTAEPGGAFTFGGVNASLYSGDIEFLDLAPSQNGEYLFWALNVSAVAVQGTSINITPGTSLAGFDTANAFIAGPSADVKAIWAAAPGSNTASGGLYQFPCTTAINITVSFGGKAWARIEWQCLGALVEAAAPSLSNPDWIFGIAFLKNVYSVLQQTPAAVGFAELSTVAGGIGTGSPKTKKKSNLGAIVGGVMGGVALIILIAVLFFNRWRRQNKIHASHADSASNKFPAEALHFLHKQDTMSVSAATPSSANPSLPSSPFPLHSVSDLELVQVATVHRHGDTYTASDVVVQTQRGLQLTPGRAPIHNDHVGSGIPSSSTSLVPFSSVEKQEVPAAGHGSLSYPFPLHSHSLSDMKRAQVAAVQRYGAIHTAQTQLPLGARPPAVASSDPAVLEELQSLREEVRRLAAEREPTDTPPSSHHGRND
ncbi:aspartic peptidase domain-containing protein [Mycena rosella]|uniref:Aspartic peptidase domain-containing protein n=1 Tax=Mycena rosella TaxID=1033263 RepID=A0AAD7CQS6_MYCRO|nr:aspartic peptidase domain-containing protein [Mycena rosella]